MKDATHNRVSERKDDGDAGEEALFAAALEQAPAERSIFLKGACLGDDALRARVEELLAAHDATANPLATQAERVAPTLKLDLAVEPPDEAVGQTLGRYKLLEQISEGGCGVVYVAEQTKPVRRRVALKVIKLGMDTKQVVARFEAERQALAMMDHPNIAKVLDAGTTENGERRTVVFSALRPPPSGFRLWSPVLRDGTGAGHFHHHLLRPGQPQH